MTPDELRSLTADDLIRVQEELARVRVDDWRPAGVANLRIGACLAISGRGIKGAGARGDRCWAAAAVVDTASDAVIARVVLEAEAGAPYEPGLLFLRIGPALIQAVKSLDNSPDVLLVDATGRDHPRRAGLALHLGALLRLPTVGVTHRPLVATGAWPGDRTGASSPLSLDGMVVGYWLRTRAGTRPLAIHAAWRTTPQTALAVVRACVRRHRTPEPLREARRLAREARGRRPVDLL